MFERLDVPLSDWGHLLAGCGDRTIFQTPEWLSFVAETQGAEPLLAAVLLDGRHAGYFAGLIVEKYGVRVLGSPMPGWTTSYMGVNLAPSVPRTRVIAELIRWAFDKLGCIHVELMDRRLTLEEASRMGCEFRRFAGFEVDLTRSEPRLFADMRSACRRCIRRADRLGVLIEEAHDPAFAEDYYAQLQEVFGKRALVPTYGIERVGALIRHLTGTGRLLLLRARDPGGRCIATGIFPAMNGTMYFWGGASRQDALRYRPNEALQWYAMKYWKARGAAQYDMGGGGEYKRKYGGRAITIPWIRQSKYPGLPILREAVRRLFDWRQRMLGRASRLAIRSSVHAAALGRDARPAGPST